MFRKFLQRTSEERALLLEAALIVPLVRFALWLIPYRIVQRRVMSWPLRTHIDVSLDRVVWSVKAIAARVPRASCLTQALAATILLARHGHAATLRVGVQRDVDGRFAAHAWLESNGTAILGEPEAGAFHVLPPVAAT